MTVRKGWMPITDTLSDFHKALITKLPKYSSIAVAEMQLPMNIGELLPDERRQFVAELQADWNANPALESKLYTENTYLVQPKVDLKVDYATAELRVLAISMLQRWAPGVTVDEIAKMTKEQQDELANRIRAKIKEENKDTPDYTRKQPLMPTFQHEILGKLEGKKGDTLAFTTTLMYLFRADRLYANDSLKGLGTRMKSILVGGRLQMPYVYGSVPFTEIETTSQQIQSLCYDPNGLLNNPFDTAGSGTRIEIEVEFLETCTFNITLKGKALK